MSWCICSGCQTAADLLSVFTFLYDSRCRLILTLSTLQRPTHLAPTLLHLLPHSPDPSYREPLPHLDLFAIHSLKVAAGLERHEWYILLWNRKSSAVSFRKVPSMKVAPSYLYCEWVGGPSYLSHLEYYVIHLFLSDSKMTVNIVLDSWIWYDVLHARASTMRASFIDSDDDHARVKHITTSERMTGGQPAVSEEVEAEAVDVGGRQVEELMFICTAGALLAQRIAHEQQYNVTCAFFLIHTTYNWTTLLRLYSILTRHLTWTNKRSHQNHFQQFFPSSFPQIECVLVHINKHSK